MKLAIWLFPARASFFDDDETNDGCISFDWRKITMPIGQISFCLCRKSPSRLEKNALRMLYKKWWIKSNKKLNFFTNSWYYVTFLSGSIHILETSFLVTSSLYLHDFLYDVFRLQGKTGKTKWKINKLLRNIFVTSLPKTTKNQVTKMGWKQHKYVSM